MRWYSPHSLHERLRALLRGRSGDDALYGLHGRFHPGERRRWREDFLRRDAQCPPSGRSMVSTQVVDGGVDRDAALLSTELAPWPSPVQRLVRAGRGSGTAAILVANLALDSDEDAGPYWPPDLEPPRRALAHLPDVGLAALRSFGESLPDTQRDEIYPYDPPHLLLRSDWEGLIDTTPDLTGADIDVSPYPLISPPRWDEDGAAWSLTPLLRPRPDAGQPPQTEELP